MTTKQLRKLLDSVGMTQRGAAMALDIHERTMRRYCAGDPIPKVVELAMLRVTADLVKWKQ